MAVDTPTTGERIAAGQRASWARDRDARRLAATIGQVRAVLRDHPEALPAVVAAANAAADRSPK